ncbi:hypothetical protein [Changjiang picorna-like virus 1]|uniref:hypothetical protein n=1 Tax=Changjiang picorna-like virus 1 TaxID=1922782 RepID=UPI00090B8302|nr:hypothetical protein [Changjiang picorna-like virus 1]APG79000.1 hypothetical protein [Changjiang picorna-like virus 1]
MHTMNSIITHSFSKPWFTHGPVSLQTEPLLTSQQDEVLVYVESACTMVYDLRRSATTQDVLVSLSTFYRSITGRSVVGTFAILLTKLVEELSEFVPRWQSSSDWIDVLDDFHKNMHRVRDSALGSKLIQVFNHVVAHTFYHKMGIEVNSYLYSKIEQGYIRPTVWNVATFADAIMSLFVFLAKAGRQALLTGSSECFFIDSGSLNEWLMEANRLRRDAEFLGNPDAVGIEVPSYLAQVDATIESGNKFAKAFKDKERMIIQSAVLELELVAKRYRVALCSSSFRRAPYGIFLYGASKIAKSFILKGLFNHYCSVRGVDKRDAILYPRNSADPYYSGFRSNMLGIVFDDVAQHLPQKVMGIDQSLGDIVSVANNIPFITHQAELADKGKIPLLCEFMGVTSNLPTMGVEFYYKNTYAVLRRMPHRIQPIVKEEFLASGSTTDIDPSKIPEGEQYPDCWRFRIATPKASGDGLSGTYHELGIVFENFRDLLKFLTPHFRRHIDQQDRLMQTVNAMGPEELCECEVPKSLCCCEHQGEMFGTIREDFIFGDEHIPEAQAFATSTEPEMVDRGDSISDVKKHLLKRQRETKSYGVLFIENFIRKEFREWMVDYMYDRERLFVTPQDFIDEFEKQWDMFDKASIRGKLYFTLQQHADKLPMDDSYLTFVPKMNGKRNFLRSQLQTVYDMIDKCLGVTGWSEPQKLALEAYVYEKVPVYLSLGWDDDSILAGAWDYVDQFACEMVPDSPGRELLRADLTAGPSLWDRFCRKCAETYVYSPTFRSTINWTLETRLGRWVAEKVYVAPHVTAARLSSTAGLYDRLLGGRHPFVLLIVTVCSAGAIVIMIRAIMGRFTPQSDANEAQVNIYAAGRKPIKRDEEKKNVWVVKERNITSLDFVPGRMNSTEQFLPTAVHNTLYVEYRCPGLRGVTRALVINNTTLLINYHAYFPGMVMTVFLNANKPGVVGAFEVCVTPGMVRIIPERDLAIITTNAMPALFKDISKNLPRLGNESVGESTLLIKGEDGTVVDLSVSGVRRSPFFGFRGDRGGVHCEALFGQPEQPTVPGDCGSPLIINTPYGPIIAGIHAAYDTVGRLSIAVPIFYEDFEHAPMVQVGVVTPAQPVSQGLTERDKLYTDFHEEGKMIVFGKLEGFRSRPKANGGHTQIAADVIRIGAIHGVTIEDRLHRPVMGGWEPIQNIVTEYLKPTHSIDELKMLRATDSFISHIQANLVQEDREDIHTVPVSVAINGYPEIPNVDAQKFTTSGGHGFPGPKKAYVTVDEKRDEWERYREYNPTVMRAVENIVEKALRGERTHPVFTTQLKDEMVSLKKLVAAKTRGFYMCPLDYLTAIRMFTLGIARVMVRRRDLFRNAVGLNTHSEEWNNLYQDACRIPGDNWVAGDFVGFDKILSILIQNFTKRVFLAVAKMGEFTDDEILALDTLISDNITAVVDFFGTLVMLLGGEVSGHQLTTFFNSVANIVLHAYAWCVIYEEDRMDEFWDNVFIRVLGDDIMAKVHPDYPEYNHSSIQGVFASIGIDYTMADKSSATRPYIPYQEVTFLKRSFREHQEFPGVMVAPLELNSIWKMLLYTIPSKAVSPEEQLAQSICSAKSEAFYHGKKVYDLVSAILDQCPKTVELEKRMEQYPAPTYQQCKERYLQASPSYRVKMGYPEISENPQPRRSYCDPLDCVAQNGLSMDDEDQTTKGRSPEEPYKAGDRLSSKKHTKRVSSEERLLVENDFLSKNMNKHQRTTDEYGHMAPSSAETAIYKYNQKRYRRARQSQWERYTAQSEVTPDTTGSISSTKELYTFQAEPKHISIDMSARNNSIATDQTMKSSLSSYMSRPERIATEVWSEGDLEGFKGTVPVWALAMTAAKREKLSGFGLFRGNLMLKFLVNGSPFYYGALAAVYTPMTGWRRDSARGGTTDQELVLASQKPHVWLNVQNTSTAEMKIPFLFPYPHINTNQLSNFTNMGRIDYFIYQRLKSANGITGTAVDVTIYAWFEDVEMTGPTNQPVAQSSIEYEKDHQISGPASAVAAAAGALSNVPVIGPYAMATSKAASMVATAANALGFTNVPNVSDVAPMRPKPFSLSSADVSEPMDKLSLSSKQEVALDMSEYGGTDADELHLKRFCGRESYVVSTTWNTTLAPATVLFTGGVTPVYAATTATEIACTPMAYASTAFQYWRGSIKFTFKAIRSKYHRGRVQISWDRSSNNLNTGALLGNANTLSTVLDLDEGDEVSMIIPYQQQSLFLPVAGIANENGDPSVSDPYSILSTPPSLTGVGWNGVINMRVLTRLTAPEATSDVAFMVFVSACDDFELAGPVGHTYLSATNILSLSNTTTTVAQSKIEYMEHAPTTSADWASTDEKVYRDVFGEQIPSLRSLLHRQTRAATFVDNSSPSASDSMRFLRIPIKHMPPAAGFWNNAWYSPVTPATSTMNPFTWHPLPWFTACFAGYRGSVNVSVNAIATKGGDGYLDHMSISRTTTTTAALDRRPSITTSATSSSTALKAYTYMALRESGATGMSLTNTRTNSSLVANLPYYSPAAFYVSDPYRTYNNQDVLSGANADWWAINTVYPQVAADTARPSFDIYYGTGPDFNVVFFVNVPMLYARSYSLL